MVEHHRHIAAECFLNGNRPLWRKLKQASVDVRPKNGGLLGDFGVLRQAIELKPATVGENWPVPAHELVQSAQIANYLLAWPQRKMIGVAQDHLRSGGSRLIDG